ncbi:MAG: glycosyltransferase [Dermatophilus congolensis]|nr:glycosyltransferase [Dermatophilus congolensis]
MRILLLANSYPTAAVPSGAPYMSARLRTLRAQSGVDVRALALRPTYSPAARVVRAVARAASDAALRLAPDAAADGWREAAVRWDASDLVAVRRGRRPERAIARATRQVVGQAAGEFDIVHAHGMYALPAGEVARRVAAQRGVPFVVSMHGSDVEEAMAAQPALAAATLRDAAATTYVSEALRQRALSLGAPQAASHVIPNGVDAACFAAGRRPHDLPDRTGHSNEPVLLFVGNLLPVKGADRLADIVDEVARQRPGVRLVVAGDGPERARLAERLGFRVDLRGRVSPDEVARLMAEADALIVPSRREGWGCVVTESYSVGTPVIASAVGGLPESVLGPEALVAQEPEGDLPGRFAQRVIEVLDNPPRADEMAAHVAGASWEAVVERELAVLREAVARRA